SDQPKRKPQRIDALGRVRASSPDLNMRETETLMLYFKDAPPTTPQLPVASIDSSSPATAPVTGKPAAKPSEAASPDPPAKAPRLTSPFQNQPSDPNKPKRPIFLSARKVTAHVLRGETRNDLERLWCEGTVHVQQEPASPEDKGVDIHGSQLELTHHVEGNVLTVIGDSAQSAQV